jgi:hypothetical protein
MVKSISRCRPIRRVNVRLLLCIVCFLFSYVIAAIADDGHAWQSRSRIVIVLDEQWQRSLDKGRSWQTVRLPRVESEPVLRILYRKVLHFDSTALKHQWHLSFGGVCDAVEVTINGQYLGRFFSGQAPFNVGIPRGALRLGRNTLELTAQPASNEAVLQNRMQWRAPLRPIGIVRPVALIGSSPQATIERILLDPHVEQHAATLRITASIAAHQTVAHTSSVTLRATLRLGSTIIATSEQAFTPIPDRTLPVTLDLRVASPALWSPESPTLYDLHVELSAAGMTIDDLQRSIAFRTVQPASAEHALFRLNGTPVVARGVVYVDEWELRTDGTLVQPRYEEDVQLLEQLGVNVVYCAWIPPSPQFLDLCSRSGIAVVLDLPFGDIPARYYAGEELRTRGQNMMVRLRDAFSTEPCVVGCVTCSMVPLTNNALQEYLRAVTPLVPTGMLRFAVVPAGHTLEGSVPLDAVFISDQTYWRGRENIESLLSRTVQSLDRLPWSLIGGALVQPNNRNGYADPLSVEAQVATISQLYRISAAFHAGGTLIRSIRDRRTLFPTLTTNTPTAPIIYEGLLDTARHRRLAFEMLRALNTNDTEPLLQAGSYERGTPYVFMAAGLSALMLLFWMLNRSRRFREYMLRAFLHSHNFFMDIRDQRILLQGHTLLLALLLATTSALVLATVLYETRQSPAADYLSNVLTLSPAGKALYIQLAWSPELAMTVIVLVVLVKIVAVALLLRMIAIVAKRTVIFADTLTMVVWAFVPLVLFLPIAMLLFRLLSVTPAALWLSLLVLTALWGLIRLLRACAIVFDEVPWLMYVTGFGSIGLLAGIILTVLQSTVAWGSYLTHALALFFP